MIAACWLCKRAVRDCCLVPRLVWALVHSTFETDVARGRELAQELLAAKELEERSEHDCIYLLSVALYRQGRLLDARRQLSELLKACTHRSLSVCPQLLVCSFTRCWTPSNC